MDVSSFASDGPEEGAALIKAIITGLLEKRGRLHRILFDAYAIIVGNSKIVATGAFTGIASLSKEQDRLPWVLGDT
jgi:hypothetical protein